MALDSGLSAMYPLQGADFEPTWPDVIGGNHLTNVNGVKQGALFTQANSTYLVCNDAPGVSCGDTTFTIGCWFQPVTTANNPCVASKGWTSNTALGREFCIYLESATNRLWFLVGDGTTTQRGIQSSVVLAAGSWYYLFCWHDSVANQLGIQIFGGSSSAPEVITHSVGVLDGTGTFRLGSAEQGLYWEGPVWQYGFWRRLLTDAEKVTLFSEGWGLGWPFPKGLDVDLRVYWKMEEATGQRYDARNNGLNLFEAPSSITGVAGKINNAAQFVFANQSALAANDSPPSVPSPIKTGDISWTYACWFYWELNTFHFILGCKGWDVTVSTKNEWMLYVNKDIARVSILGWLNGSAQGTNSAVALSANTWYLAIGWYDSVNDLMGVQVNNETPVMAGPTGFGGGTGGATGSDGNFLVGRTQDGQWCTGKIDEVGFWKRVLTDSERSRLWNGGAGISAPFSDLNRNLVARWSLDGNGFDSFRNSNLIDENGVGYTPGKLYSAVVIKPAPTYASLWCANNPYLQVGDIDFTFAAWWYPYTLAGNPAVASKGWTSDTDNTHDEWIINLETPTGRLYFVVGNGIALSGVWVISSVVIVPNTWNLVIAWHDSVNNQLGIQVNNQPPDMLAHSTGVYTGTGKFRLGATDVGYYLDGKIDEACFWRRVLSPSDRNLLWSGGYGLEWPWYPDIPKGQPARKRLGGIPHARLTRQHSVW